ncbi:MAG: hypothetical protein ASARMPREDX12_004370 [Alectoria sarmentosa]|nr:MAG: hypothetical protein ASARMPREDX12_004370 [Alectoria sarmentosa]
MRLPGSPTYLLRNLGLEIFVFILIRLWFGLSPEPTKPVVKKSFWVGFSRCLIHILPVTVSLVLFRLNLGGFYIGHGFSQQSSDDLTDQGNDVKLALIQVAAKVQELLVISSYGVIIFSVTRDRLLHKGIPLGLAASGLSFARISYFWSPALWGAISALITSSKIQGVCLLILITLGGLIATTAGPASAILMLPRPTNWPEFTTDFWLNGTADVYWPSKLTSDHLGGPRCSSDRGLGTIECVAKGISSLESFYNYYRSQSGYEISTVESQFPRILQAIPRKAGISAESWSVAPHAATSLLKNDLWYDPHWYPANFHSTGIRYAETYSQAAAVRTVCTRDVLIFSNATFDVSLPNPPAYDLWAKLDDRSGNHTAIKLAKPLWGTHKGAHTEQRGLTTVWIPPKSDMESVTTGLVILGPLASTSATERFGVVCSIDGRWNKAMHVLTGKGNTVVSLANQASISVVQSGKRSDRVIPNNALPINDGSWRHIAAEQAWLEALTPLVPQYLNEAKTALKESTMTTALANLFIAANILLRTDNLTSSEERYWIQNIETVTSTAMADAISRVGLGQQYDTHQYYTSFGTECTGIGGASPRKWCPGPPPYNQSSLLAFHGFLTGYAYKASRVTDYLSIVVLLLHMVAALAHTLYLLFTRLSSASWDTVEELIVLAQVSTTDTKDLRNTSAGIKRFSTMALNTRVRTSGSGAGEEKVELLIGGAEGEKMGGVEEGEEYGNVD